MPTYEGFRLKVNKFFRVKFAEKRKKDLKNLDFTIISNNCWGGMVYESYNLLKDTPTVGLFFSAQDYIKFLTRLDEYLGAELTFEEEASEQGCPVGILSIKDESIKINFLHYHSREQAADKWRRRCSRVNKENMLVKFNDQNGCTEEDLKAFLKLPYKYKLFFTVKDWQNVPHDECIIKIKQAARKDFVLASYEPYGKSRYIDVTELLNKMKQEQVSV